MTTDKMTQEAWQAAEAARRDREAYGNLQTPRPEWSLRVDKLPTL